MSIVVRDLSYGYGNKEVLKQLSFSLDTGFNLLLGPNGAGKSTLFSLLTGLFNRGQGEIELCGLDLVQHRRAALSKIGVVFQQSTLDLDLSVKQNLIYQGSLHGLSAMDSLNRVAPILEKLELSQRLNERVRVLNGGHKRRLEITRSLMHRPKVILLDEPTVGLDTDSRLLIIEHVRRLAKEMDICVLWATHLMDEANGDDVLLLLDRGQISAAGQCQQLYTKHGVNDLFELYRKLTQQVELM
ncbi:ATP-binding cassette domain-containing protein [Shewanella woodyi]|uniref:ATP-binding cassette domain-containing protein n=1 Tax=Shewanella woodyi TaxID=60961 RepID=UPI00374847A5